MDSEIWRVRTEKIGCLEPFKSEYDMEAFLMNNPAIIGCWNPESSIKIPTLIRNQIYTKKIKGSSGRIDLIGISVGDDADYELKIFELKVNAIDTAAVEQLQNYINGWNKEGSGKKRIRQEILNLGLDGVDENNISKIIDEPSGVLVGSEFNVDAIVKSQHYGLEGIRLSRFKAESGTDYYVIIEDQIGDVIKSAKRQNMGWSEFVENGIIKGDDIFYLKTADDKVRIKPDPQSFHTKSKKMIFDDKSIKKIMDRKEAIIKKGKKAEVYWIEDELKAVSQRQGIIIYHATAIVFFAFGKPKSYWVPSPYWIHERSGESLEQLKNRL